MDLRKLIERAKSDISGILSDLELDIESLIADEKQNSYDAGYNEAEKEERKKRES